MTKISDLSALTGVGVDAANDLVTVVDMSEAGAARNKKMTFAELRQATAIAGLTEWALNFSADGDAYIPAVTAMTIAAGNAAIGTGSASYLKSTTAAPSTFTSTTLPVTLQAGAWLKVSVSGVAPFYAIHLMRTG